MIVERSLALVLFEMAFLVLAGPLVTGIIQKIKARLQCRQGAGVLQPYRDLTKLLRKGTVQADTASGNSAFGEGRRTELRCRPSCPYR